MKKLILVALLAIGVSTFAQERMERERKSPEERSAMLLKKMTSDLNLDSKQQAQIKQVIAEQDAKREAMKAERMANKDLPKEPTPEERKARREKFEEGKLAMEAKLKTILTPEQFAKWNTIKEERKDKMKDKMKERKEEKK